MSDIGAAAGPVLGLRFAENERRPLRSPAGSKARGFVGVSAIRRVGGAFVAAQRPRPKLALGTAGDLAIITTHRDTR